MVKVDSILFPSFSFPGHLKAHFFHLSYFTGNRGMYSQGYLDNSAFRAKPKTNTEIRKAGDLIEDGEKPPGYLGIRGKNSFAKYFPRFDTVQGFLMDFFHKMFLVSPNSTSQPTKRTNKNSK